MFGEPSEMDSRPRGVASSSTPLRAKPSSVHDELRDQEEALGGLLTTVESFAERLGPVLLPLSEKSATGAGINRDASTQVTERIALNTQRIHHAVRLLESLAERLQL